MATITILINRGPVGPVDTALRDLLTTDDRSGVRLMENSDGGYELCLWNEDLGDYVALTAIGTGANMTTAFIEIP